MKRNDEEKCKSEGSRLYLPIGRAYILFKSVIQGGIK